MPKEKRIYHAEIVPPGNLRLETPISGNDQKPGSIMPKDSRESLLSPELIARLTERIKKL